MQRKNVAGALLRMERIRQNRGQKEICYGICVPSYMSKIEHGTVCPDEKLLAALFLRLGVAYEEDPDILAGWEEKIAEYFERLHYGLDTKTVYAELKEKDVSLLYSRYGIDWLLIKGFEDIHQNREVMALLKEICGHMQTKQLAYYRILQFWETPGKPEGVEYCKEACELLPNSFALTQLCHAYMMQGDYTSIHRMENRLTAAAVEEGNTYRLADYFFINGSAYACLNLEEMMLVYYERSIRLLQNTGWKDELSDLYYNLGATYISLKEYELALKYLDQAGACGAADSIAVNQKKALAYVRSGRKKEAGEFLEKIREQLSGEEGKREVDFLKYQEACWECEENFMENPRYLELLERLIREIRQNCHFGHLYFYRDVITEAYIKQRKYKKALEFEWEVSSKISK